MEATKFKIGFAVMGLMLILLSSGVLAVPSVHDVAGTAKLNGVPVPPGTLIVAKDSQGNEMGTFTVATPGLYGVLHVNGDDPGSTGNVISFFINGTQAGQTLVWQPFGYDPNFNLTACDLSTYSITAGLDSGSYNPGQNMTITGYLVNSQCSLEPGKAVAYSVPSTAIMGQIQTNGTGYFSAIVTIPSDMPVGNYTLWASFPPGANQTVYSTVNFTVSQPPAQPATAGGSSGGGGGGGGCSPSWNCTAFSDCLPNGTQTRVCTDKNSCGTSSGKPAEIQNCTYTAPGTGNQSACTPGTRVCAGNDLMECSSEGQFVKIQACQYGCSGNACLEKPAETGPGNQTGGGPVTGFFLLEPSAWPYWVIIIVVIVLVWYLLRGGGGKKKPARGKK